MHREERQRVPTITEDFFRQSEWVKIQDTYDHDWGYIGPFPSTAEAHEFCDCFNRSQRGEIASCRDYDGAPSLTSFKDSPASDTSPCDYEAIAIKYGAKPEHEWRNIQYSQIEVKECWCASLHKGIVPSAPTEHVTAYLFKALIHKRSLFTTSQHYGEVDEFQCFLCYSPVIKLFVEHEGYGNCWHSYYTFPTMSDLKRLEAKELNEDTYESYVESRCGIHKNDYYSSFFKRVKIGYVGIDHRTLE